MSKTLSLSACVVTVNELTVGQVRNIINQMDAFAAIDLASLLLNRFDEAVALLGDVLVFSGDASLDKVTFSELSEIKQVFLEVNAAFLELTGLTALFLPESAATQIEPASTAAVSHSSSADTVALPDTAGASS